uniref:Ranatuerin-2Ra n=1 Tax=Pelophylax ridibundus TaxID=8406 RepID=RN2A_PELRI|nr:RecName: Full=Ranatuerin-2Ra [Pelophylax ridibundus]
AAKLLLNPKFRCKAAFC